MPSSRGAASAATLSPAGSRRLRASHDQRARAGCPECMPKSQAPVSTMAVAGPTLPIEH